jgi:hypothetical protein
MAECGLHRPYHCIHRITALGGSILLVKLSNLWAHVTGIWLVIECLGWFGLFLCSFAEIRKREEGRRALEITGAILYALLDDSAALSVVSRRLQSDPSYNQCILVKIRLEPSHPKNLKEIAISLRHGEKLCDGSRLPVASGMFITKLPDGVHYWRKHAQQERVDGDIENKLAHDDALLLSSPCSGWLSFACRGSTIKRGDMVAIIVTVTDETGYRFAIRDDLVHVH